MDFGAGFTSKQVPADGATLAVTVGGKGPPVLLIHGYAESGRMWKPLAIALAQRFTVIAFDLPGFGESSIPASDLDLMTASSRLHTAMQSLGFTGKTRVVGHDIGLMVAYAYAAKYRQEVEQLVLMDAFLPGVGDWRAIYDNPAIWHFRFHGPTPEALVKGRERTYFEHYWNDFAADKTHSIPEAERRAYTEEYARPGRMAAGWSYFASFPQTAIAFAEFAKTKLTIPLLCVGGAKANGKALAAQCKIVGSDVTVETIEDAGHWLLEEKPQQTIAAIDGFLK